MNYQSVEELVKANIYEKRIQSITYFAILIGIALVIVACSLCAWGTVAVVDIETSSVNSNISPNIKSPYFELPKLDIKS